MRVLAIRGRNLASLEGEFEVDFTSPPLADAGVFAISGPTGAGKSTLLDALCLALYHDTPRLQMAVENNVKVPDVNEDGVSPQDPRNLLRRGTGEGYAEVDFVGRDNLGWRARWSVRRAREKATGRLQQPSAELRRLDTDDVVATNTREVAAAIQQCVGLSFDQFRRAVLLAQNDFAALLKARQSERADLLEALTSTEIFSTLSRRAHELHGGQRREIEEMRQRLGLLEVLDDDARAALDRAIDEARSRLAALQAQGEALRKEVGWHEGAQRYAAELSRLEQDLAGLNAERARREQEGKDVARWELLAPLCEPWSERVESDAELTRLGEQLVGEAAKLAPAREEEERSRQALDEARSAVSHASAVRADAEPAIRRARKLDQELAAKEQNLSGVKRQLDDAANKVTELTEALERAKREIGLHEAEIHAWAAWREAHPRLAVPDVSFDRLGELLQTIGSSDRDHEAARKSLVAAAADLESLQKQLQDSQNLLTAAESAEQDAVEAEANARLAVEALDPSGLEATREEHAARQSALEAVHHGAKSLEAARTGRQKLQEDAARNAGEIERIDSELIQMRGRQSAAEAAVGGARAVADRARLAEEVVTAKLRETLEPGQPCLVCGATEHPGAAADDRATRALVGELERQLRDAETSERELGQQIAGLDQAMHHARARDLELRAGLDEAERTFAQEWDAMRARVAQIDAGELLVAFEEGGAKWSQALSGLIDRLHGEKAQLEQRKAELERAREAQTNAEEKRRQATAHVRSAREERDRIGSALQPKQLEQTRLAIEAGSHARSRDLALDEVCRLCGLSALDAEDASAMQALWESGVPLREAANQAQAPLTEARADFRTAGENLVAQEAHQISLRDQHRVASEDYETTLQARRECLQADDAGSYEDALAAAERDARAQEARRQEALERAKNERVQREAAYKKTEVDRGHAERRRERVTSILRKLLDELSSAFDGPVPELEELDGVLAAIPEDLEARADAWRTLEQAIHDRTVRCQQAREQLDAHLAAQGSARSAEAANEALSETVAAIETEQALVADHEATRRQDDDRKRASAKQRADIETRIRDAERWRVLDQLIGSASGDKFKRYAQQFTLEVLLEYANQHLDRLAPRYQLQRGREELSLLVVDRDFGDEVRSVHSLSGGESFLVSLGLALGLASLSSERVRVESLFIDEGFGSLDGDTLNVAMEALDRLQSEGRRVGVISHVHDMAERIGTRIHVESTAPGRSQIRVIR